MSGKLIEDLYISAAAGITKTYYSAPVGAGDANGVMGELWVTSIGGTLGAAGIKLFVEGGNDGINFDPNAAVSMATGVTVAPAWTKTAVSSVVPWSWYRLRVEIQAGAADASALVSASIRNFRAA